MYYEERWIDGKFCWRTSPNGAWTAYTANELAHRYQAELQRAHDLQRALDAEREKVKELEEGKGYLIRLWGLVAPQCEILTTLVGLATQFDNYIAGQNHELATLQAQLAEIEQILCIESGKTTVDKVRDLHQSFKQVWNSYQGAGNDLFDMQAQLRQVEGERDAHAQRATDQPHPTEERHE